MIALVLSAAVMAGVFIVWAVRNDNADFHLMHGPHDGCVECEDK